MRSWMIGMVLGAALVGTMSRLPPSPASLVLGGIALCFLRWPGTGARLLCGLCCGAVLGIAHGNALLLDRVRVDCVAQPLQLVGQVVSLPIISKMPDNNLRQRFEFSVSDIIPASCAGPSKVALSYYSSQHVVPGDRWQFSVKLKRPWGLANPGSYNLQAWYAQKGIDALGSVRGEGQRVGASGWRFLTVHHRLRRSISTRIDELPFERDVRAVLKALTVADKSAIGQRLWLLFQTFGINHLLVISGLHVGLVAGAGYLLGGICSRLLGLVSLPATWAAGVVALALAAVYAALAGFSLPTQRALFMLACFVVAKLCSRGSTSFNSLLVAAVLILAANPLAALGSGFWLSFGAVAALLWLSQWRRNQGRVQKLLYTHGFMSLAMLPLGALFFDGASIVAMLANMIMIPVIGFCVVPAALVAALAFLCHWPVETVFWQMAAWPLQQVLPLAVYLSETAGGGLYHLFVGQLQTVTLGLAAVALVILPVQRALKLMALILALPMLLVERNTAAPAEPGLQVAVLDVGQGTSVVVRAGKRALLYDTGGGNPFGSNAGSSVVLPYLRRHAIERLDTFVISHPDLDHSAGALDIAATLAVDRLRYGQPLAGLRAGQRCAAGESWRWPGGQTFRFLSPAGNKHKSSNNSSCVLQIEAQGYRLLLPGDIERDGERNLVRYWGQALASDWLLAAHHGSKTSSSSTLLKHLQVSTVVISNGYANRFGHPHPLVLRRLQEQAMTVISTANGGALEFELGPGRVRRYSAYREQKRRYWM